jgi:integrase
MMASVEKRQGPRGVRYDVRYRDPAGRPRKKAFRRRADADRFARQVETDKDRGLFIDPQLARRSISEVAYEWLESNPGKRDGTWQRDEIIVRRHIVPAVGAQSIGGATPSDVQGLVNRWAGQLAPRTVNRQYDVVRAIFNHAVNNDMRPRTPCRGIKLPEVVPVVARLIDADDLANLSEELGGVGKLGPTVYLATVDGMRWGETHGVKVGCLDREAGSVDVSKINVRGRKGKVQEGEPKSAKGRRTLAVPSELMAMLVEHMAARGLTTADTDALLFVSPKGQRIRYTNWLRRVWYPACVAVGLGRMVKDPDTKKESYEGLNFHDLRKNTGTGLVAAGVDPKTAQQILGHADVRTTLEIYAQAVPELGRQAAAVMGGKFMAGTARPKRAKTQDAGSEGTEARTRKEGL